MNRLKALAGAAALSLAASAAQAQETSVASQAMQCYTMYNLMMEKNPSDPYRNDVLGSQVVFMGTLYVMNAGSEFKPVSKEQFDQANAMAEKALLTIAATDRIAFVDKLIHCEGWREEVLIHLALATDGIPADASEEVARSVLSNVPAPRKNYPLKGVSLLELNRVVDQALAQYLK